MIFLLIHEISCYRVRVSPGSVEIRWLGGSFVMVHRNNADSLCFSAIHFFGDFDFWRFWKSFLPIFTHSFIEMFFLRRIPTVFPRPKQYNTPRKYTLWIPHAGSTQSHVTPKKTLWRHPRGKWYTVCVALCDDPPIIQENVFFDESCDSYQTVTLQVEKF